MANRKLRLAKTWKWLAIAAAILLLIVGIGGWWVATQVLPYAIIGTSRLERTVYYSSVTPASIGLTAEAVELPVEPQIRLKGWFIRAEGSAKGTVLLLHGHNSCKEAELRLAKLFAKQGFNSLAYDSRGCGESGGRFCTFGFYEKRDCSAWIDLLQQRFGLDAVGPVSIYGVSFGGAVALQAMAADSRFHCGIVESTFATLPEIVRDYGAQMAHVRFDALANLALKRAGTLAHFPPDAVRPEEAARSVRCPVLVIHGLADQHIAHRYGERIYRNLQTVGSRWLPIEGATHNDLWSKGGAGYENALLSFLETNGH